MVLAFLHLIENLKTTPRAGWKNERLENTESIADHMYRMSIICLLCTDASLDRSRLVHLALIHDMAESLVGDITPTDGVPKHVKQQLEMEAMQSICDSYLPASAHEARKEFMALFLEYEHKASPEARFVKDVDKYELVLQTIEYERRHDGSRNLEPFVRSSKEIEHPLVKGWCNDALAERDAFWKQVRERDGSAAASDGATAMETPVGMNDGTMNGLVTDHTGNGVAPSAAALL